MTLVQTELKKIYLGQNVADMQGPCPTGFHVPTQTERGNLISLLSTLGITTGNDMKLYLKLPFAGIVYGSTSWDKQYLNVYGSYYASSPAYESGGLNRVKGLQIDTSNINNDYSPTRNTALPIRPFKDIPSIPDGSRTALYSDKIYHNSTLGLISISDDGTNRITIADKNLGATVVYNDGDTLSQANCGNYYQWGNNYGFPFTGAVTTSSTQVDASNYGPGNYYSSSTFIYNNTNYDWSSVSNPNLRGGATKEIKRITIRPNGTEKQIRPAGWTPGANTVLYVPMKSDLLDHGPNNISLTNTSVTIQNVSGVSAGYFPAQNNKYNLRGNITSYISSKPFTISVWVNALQLPTGSNPTPYISIFGMLASGPYRGAMLTLGTTGFYSELLVNDGSKKIETSFIPTLGVWYLITLTVNSDNSNKLYINGQVYGSNSYGYTDYFGNFVIGADRTDNDGLLRHWRGYMSEFIIEDKVRTAQEISDYYNLTKGNYGIQLLNMNNNLNQTPINLGEINNNSGSGDVLTM